MYSGWVYCIVYLYSAQYLHVLQDSKRYMTHPTVQVQSNSQVTDIPLTGRQRLKDDPLSTSLRFFNLPLGIGSIGCLVQFLKFSWNKIELEGNNLNKKIQNILVATL